MKRVYNLLLLFFSILATMSCGNGNVGEESSTEVSDTGVTHYISIIGMSYVPDTLTVSIEDEVIWVNEDFLSHDVSSIDEPKTKTSGLMNPGDTYSLKIMEEYDYLCSLHPTMKGVILIDSL